MFCIISNGLNLGDKNLLIVFSGKRIYVRNKSTGAIQYLGLVRHFLTNREQFHLEDNNLITVSKRKETYLI